MERCALSHIASTAPILKTSYKRRNAPVFARFGRSRRFEVGAGGNFIRRGTLRGDLCDGEYEVRDRAAESFCVTATKVALSKDFVLAIPAPIYDR